MRLPAWAHAGLRPTAEAPLPAPASAVPTGTRERWPPVLSETPNVDGERSFWSRGPARRLCTGHSAAAPHARGFLAAFPSQGQPLLFLFSSVVSDCTEITVIFDQQVLNADSISIFQVIRCPLQIILLFLLFPLGKLLAPTSYWKPLKLLREIFGNFSLLCWKAPEVSNAPPQGGGSPASGRVPHHVHGRPVRPRAREAHLCPQQHVLGA